MRLLLHALLFTGTLGALYLVMSRRGPLSPISFAAAGAVAHLVIGMLLAAPVLAGQLGRSWTTAFWTPVLALGFFVTGAVLAAAWLGAVRGTEWFLRSRRAAPPPPRKP